MEVKTFKDIWKKLIDIDVTPFTKKKKSDGKEYGYIPWAVAWGELVKIYPDSTYKVHVDTDGFPCFYKDGIGAFCRTSVTIEGYTRTMDLPVLNFANKAMKIESYSYTVNKYVDGRKQGTIDKNVGAINSFDVNTTKWRCLVKNLAMFGFGIKLFANSDWETQTDDDGVAPWADERLKKIGGKGKHAEKTWAEVAVSQIYWYIDPANSKYTRRLAPLAQRELDFRSNMDDDNADVLKDKTDPLHNMRLDVQAKADDILKERYKQTIQYDFYTDAIAKAKTNEDLIIISARIDTIDILVTVFNNDEIDAEEFKIYLLKISTSANGELQNLSIKLKTLSPEASKNRDLLEHYWNEITTLFKELGYEHNASLSINSMKKNLGSEDMYSILDVKKLEKYEEHLRKKLKDLNKTTKDKHLNNKVETLEPENNGNKVVIGE